MLVLALTGETARTGSAKDAAFFVAGSTGVVVLGTVQLMKLANRRTQRRIASGEFPDFEALGTGTTTEEKFIHGPHRQAGSQASPVRAAA